MDARPVSIHKRIMKATEQIRHPDINRMMSVIHCRIDQNGLFVFVA
jgi:hypothetical protein